jgi:3',5'-cyclic AMP phosphodiesterase CpdA
MSSVSILHASDLHISFHKQLRSPLDQLNDLENRWDLSGKGLSEKQRILKQLLIAWRQESSASSYDPETLEALAEFIYEKARKKPGESGETIDGSAELDAVVLTGDLATTGTRDDIAKTHQFLTAPYDVRYPHKSSDTSYRGATLSGVGIPIIYLPGNHDRYVPTRDFYGPSLPKFFNPGGTNFDSIISDFRADPIQMAVIESVDSRLKVIIFAVDFTLEDFSDHEGFYGWLAQGRAYSNIRKDLLAQTKKAVEDHIDQSVVILWAIHFPPYYPGINKHSSLLAEDKLITAANSSGVTAILAGHTHKQLSYKHPFMSPEVYCCGTTTQFEPMRVGEGGPDRTRGNFLQIIKVSLDQGGSVHIGASHYRYSATGSVHGPSLMQWAPVP